MTARTARSLILALALGLAGAAAAEAQVPPAPKGPRSCFFERNMNGWRDVGQRQVNVRVGVNDVYTIALDAPCINLPWTERIGIENRGGAGSICTGDLVTVIAPGHGTGPDRCFGRVTAHLTPEQAKALPPKERP